MRSLRLLLFIVFSISLRTIAQSGPTETLHWTRIETADKCLSLSFPRGYIVDAEKRSRQQSFRIVGWHDGVMMELIVFSDHDSKKRLQYVRQSELFDTTEFQKDGFSGKHYNSGDFRKEFEDLTYLAYKNNFYEIHLRAADGSSEAIQRFLF